LYACGFFADGAEWQPAGEISKYVDVAGQALRSFPFITVVRPAVRQEFLGMYAVFEDGSHQYRVQEGDFVQVDHRQGVAGDELIFGKVLLIVGEGEPTLGAPVIDGARVVAKIVNQFRAKKIIIQKFRRRKNMRRRRGHRQPYTTVQIMSLAAAS